LLSKVKLILITFILLATFGQAVASSVMSCTMDMQSQSQNMDHAMHQMAGDMDMKMNASDEACCEQECRCTIGSCFSLALTADASTDSIDSSLVKLNYASLMMTGQSPSSLYRPPIS